MTPITDGTRGRATHRPYTRSKMASVNSRRAELMADPPSLGSSQNDVALGAGKTLMGVTLLEGQTESVVKRLEGICLKLMSCKKIMMKKLLFQKKF